MIPDTIQTYGEKEMTENSIKKWKTKEKKTECKRSNNIRNLLVEKLENRKTWKYCR